MGQKSSVVMASWFLVGAALSGCQSSDSWRAQGPSRFPNAGTTPLSTMNNPNASAAARPLGMNSATNNQAGVPATPGIQPAGGAQTPGTAATPANPWANSKPLAPSNTSPSASVTQRQTDITVPALPSARTSAVEKEKAVGPDPVPPAPPSFSSGSDQASGTYSIPAPKAYTPPANSEVKTRVPGDDN